jgi:ABC-type nitrate/sulfonate/bicarbonate transport system substrate-binding protein
MATKVTEFITFAEGWSRSNFVVLVTLLTFCGVGSAFAAAAPLEKSKVTVTYTSLAGGFAALWIADEKEYFKDYGLDVESVYTSTVTGVQAVLAGNAQFTGAGCYNVMLARRAGADLVLLANLRPYNPYILITRSDLVNSTQLAGTRIAINRFGDSTHFSALGAVRELGIDPASITFVQGRLYRRTLDCITDGFS